MRYAEWSPGKTARVERAALEELREIILSPSVPASPENVKPLTIPEAADRFGIPRSTLYALARHAPDNGVPIIKLTARQFRINPIRFAEWLYAEAGSGRILSGRRGQEARHASRQ